MIKNIKKIWWLIVVLVLLFLAYFLFNVGIKERINNNQNSNNSSEENVSNNSEKSDNTVEFVPEMMSTEEKKTIGMGAQMNIQVISRDEEGKIKAYKIIRTPGDIINLNQ